MPDPATNSVIVEEQPTASLAALVCFVRRRLADPRLPASVVVISFLNALEASGEPEATVPWFYRVVRLVIESSRRSSAGQDKEDDSHLFADVIASDDEQRFIGHCFRRILPTLDPKYADVLERVDLGGESIAGVAAELGLPASAVTAQLRAGRIQLRERLEQICAPVDYEIAC